MVIVDTNVDRVGARARRALWIRRPETKEKRKRRRDETRWKAYWPQRLRRLRPRMRLHRHGAVLVADGITFIGHNQSRTSCGAISRGCIHSLHAEAAAIQRCVLQSKGTPKVP